MRLRFYVFGVFALIFVYSGVLFFSFNPAGDPFSGRYSKATFDRDGKILSAFLNPQEQWHLKSTAPLPRQLKIAITEFEDKRFFSHFGIDFYAILRSLWHNLNSERRSGASTITMQTIKLLRGDSRTYFNKFREIIFALKLEALYSKDEILEFYANNAPYGGNIVGVQTAALMYFEKDLSQASWGEAALLAVLPNSPGAMHLQKNTQKLLNKRNTLLEKLHAKGIIDNDNLKLALSEPLPRIKRTKNIAPHLSLRLASAQNALDSAPNIHTTIDKSLQLRLESILKNHHQKLSTLGIQNVAAIIVDTHSREVVAYGGSQDFFDIDGLGQIDGITAKRSVGSVLKPLLYALAIDRGLIAPQSKLIDAPTIWGNFKPRNASKRHYGFVSAQSALVRSLNVPFVALLQDYGYERFFYDLQNILGFSDENFERYGLSLILGTKELSVEDVARIYTGLGNYGEFAELKYLKGNSSLGTPCGDLADFGHCADFSLALRPKSAKNSTTSAANTRICDLDSANPTKNAESTLDSAISQNLNQNNSARSAHLESRPLRGAKNREQGRSSASADFLLEAESRGSPPKSEKRQLLGKHLNNSWGEREQGGAAFLREETSENNGNEIVKSARDFSPTAQNDNFSVRVAESPTKRLLSEGASFLTLQAMSRLDRFGIENFYKNQKIFSWKSGTSYGRKDAWAAGTSPRYTIVVWAGNFDGSANPNLFGVNIAGDLLFEILGIWRDLGTFEAPQGALKQIKVDALTGYAWDFDDVKFMEISYPTNARPLRQSPYLRRIFVDKNGAEVSSKSGDFLSASAKSVLNLPLNLLDFFASQNGAKARENSAQKSRNLKILYPKEGIKIRTTRDFKGENALIARIANVKNRSVFWYLDGEFIGAGEQKSRTLNAESGSHTMSVVDENGEGDSVRFVVE